MPLIMRTFIVENIQLLSDGRNSIRVTFVEDVSIRNIDTNRIKLEYSKEESGAFWVGKSFKLTLTAI